LIVFLTSQGPVLAFSGAFEPPPLLNSGIFEATASGFSANFALQPFQQNPIVLPL